MPNLYNIRLGPAIEKGLSAQDLRQRAETGMLTHQHEVQLLGTDLWFPAGELVGLWIAAQETPPALRTFRVRRWSTIVLGMLYLSANTLKFQPGRFPPPSCNTFQAGVIAAALAYFIGEYIEYRSPLDRTPPPP